jgi:nicotinamide riboside transporter PnuC
MDSSRDQRQLPLARFEFYKWAAVLIFGVIVTVSVRAYSAVHAIKDRYFYGGLFAISCIAFYLTTKAMSAVGRKKDSPQERGYLGGNFVSQIF